MEVKQTVYIVLIDSYDSVGSIIECVPFSSLEEAKQHLKVCADDFKENVSNWDDTDIYTVEETDESFTWFETGFYEQNHYCLDIYERTVNTGLKEEHNA